MFSNNRQELFNYWVQWLWKELSKDHFPIQISKQEKAPPSRASVHEDIQLTFNIQGGTWVNFIVKVKSETQKKVRKLSWNHTRNEVLPWCWAITTKWTQKWHTASVAEPATYTHNSIETFHFIPNIELPDYTTNVTPKHLYDHFPLRQRVWGRSGWIEY